MLGQLFIKPVSLKYCTEYGSFTTCIQFIALGPAIITHLNIFYFNLNISFHALVIVDALCPIGDEDDK